MFALILAFRVIAGLIFSALVFNQPEGHMLILFDLPALAAYGASNRLFGIPCCITGAFSADYLLSSAAGWLCLAIIAGAATSYFASRYRQVAAG